MSTSSDLFLTLLGALDCCSTSDALDKLGLHGQVTSLHRRSGTGRIVGRAVTVKLGIDTTHASAKRHLGTMAIHEADSESIIVIEQRTSMEAACWGGLLTVGAQVKGVRGVVADGPVRDIDEARELNFPIFCNRTTCFTARGRVNELGTNVPVMVADVLVRPGDYVVADDSAIVFIAPSDIQRVLEAAKSISLKEIAMARALRTGVPAHEVMDGRYEMMLEDPR